MTDTLSQLTAVQHRADVLQEVQEILADTTKILSNDIVSDAQNHGPMFVSKLWCAANNPLMNRQEGRGNPAQLHT